MHPFTVLIFALATLAKPKRLLLSLGTTYGPDKRDSDPM